MRLRRATGVERQQIKWFAYAGAAFAIGIFLNIMIIAPDTTLWFERAGLAYFTVSGTAVPISIGIAILRYRLYDMGLIINRALVYGSLWAMLVTLYFGTFVLLQRLFVQLTGE